MKSFYQKTIIGLFAGMLLLLVSVSVSAQSTGIFQTYVVVDVDGNGNQFYAGGSNPENIFAAFDGTDFGNISSLVLNGGEVKTFKNDGGDVFGAEMFYTVHLASDPTGSFTSINFPFEANLPNSGDQLWQELNAGVDITSGLACGTYHLEVYFQSSTNLGDRFDSDPGDNNFTATFTITDPGYYDDNGVCTICPPGSFCPGDGTIAQCPAGRYSDIAGAASCTLCEVGTFQANEGATFCEPCAAGTFQSSQGQISCESCPAGTFSDITGSSACSECPAGTYQANQGAIECLACDPGFCQNETGQTECFACGLADLVLTASTATASECDRFTVMVSVVTADTYNTVEARLSFDPNELQVVEVTAPDGSNVLTSNPPFNIPAGPTTEDNVNGLVAYSAGSTTDIVGNNDFIRITFEVIGNGGPTSITPVTTGFPRSRVVFTEFVDGVSVATDILNEALPIDINLGPDTEDPTFNCLASAVRNTDSGECAYTVQGTEFDPTDAADNCGIASVINSITNTASLAGVVLVDGDLIEWTVTDVNGNSAVCSFTVTVNDNQQPVASCQDVSLTLDANGVATLLPFALDDGSLDNCGIMNYSLDKSNFTCADLGENFVILTVTDGAGNFSSCGAVVTVTDLIDPTAVCQDATIALDGSGNATILASAVDNGSSDNCGTPDINFLSCPADLAFDQDLTSEILFGTGNANGAFTIGSNGDVELGIRAKVRFPNPASVYNSNGDGSYNHLTGAFGGTGVESGWNFDWSVNSDASGSSGLNLDDLTYEMGIDFDPTDGVDFVVFDPINQPFADHGVGTNSTANGGGSVAGDPSAYASLIASNNVAQNSWRHNFFGAFDGNVDGRYDVYLKAYDGSGDVVAATGITVIAGAGTGSAFDGCLMPLESLNFDCADLGANPVTLLVRDASGNEDTCTAIVTVEDNELPTLTCPADITVELSTAPDPFVTGMATGSDNCGFAITYSDDRTGLTGCNETGVLVRTFTITDDSGQEVSCTQNITIEDTEAPEAPICPADIAQTADAGQCSAVVNFTAPGIVLDNKYVEGFENVDFVSGDAATLPFQGWNNYASNLSRVVSGTNGVASSEGAAHAVIDTNNSAGFTGAFSRLGGYNSNFGEGYRVQADVYIDLSDAGVAADTYGWDLSVASSGQDGNHQRDFIFHAASNVAGNVLIGGSNNSNFTRQNVGSFANFYEITASGWYTFEWNFRDNGSDELAVDLNLIDGSGTVLWTETRSNPADLISTEVGGNRYMWFTFLEVETLAIDDVQVLRNVATTCNAADGDTFNVGTTTVTCDASDACGNLSSCSFEVTVTDDELPTISCPGDQAQVVDANCQSALADYTALATANDNCSFTVTQSPAAGTLVGLGATTVTLTVTDASNNVAVCDFDVTVADNTAPTITCPADITVGNDAGACGANVSWTVPTGSDNCSVASVVGSANPGDFFPVGTTTVEYTVTDGAGLTALCSFTVTVDDTELPAVSCAGDATVTVNQTNGTYLVSGGEFDPTVSDNCPGVSVSHDAASVLGTSGPNNVSLDGWELPVGTTTITFTAIDAAGNTDFCAVTITVESPVISGEVTLNGACLPLDMTVSVYEAGTPNASPVLVATYTGVEIATDGTFSLDATGIVPGSYDIYIKPENYLTKFAGNYTIDASPTNVTASNMVPGDISVNEDDVINGDDLSLILDAYNTQDGIDAAYDGNADINCDGFVDALDLSLLIFFFLDGGDSAQL